MPIAARIQSYVVTGLRLAIVCGLIVGCSGGGSEAPSATGPAADTNRPPEIAGTPPLSVTPGNTYEFLPTANDPDGDLLNFSISATPSWATFDSDTGRLTGLPSNADAGDYPDIIISVSDGASSASLSAFTITVATATFNSPPTIGGTPAPSVVQNSPYSFTPVASDPDGDALTFSIQGMPAWATFDELSGTLAGTPTQGDVDTYPNISITVSDGSSTSSLPAFSITVNTSIGGTVALNWAGPTTNVDGTNLADLARYRIYWGTDPNNPSQSVFVNDPVATSYSISGLSPGTYHFVIVAVDAAGNESSYSNSTSATIP